MARHAYCTNWKHFPGADERLRWPGWRIPAYGAYRCCLRSERGCSVVDRQFWYMRMLCSIGTRCTDMPFSGRIECVWSCCFVVCLATVCCRDLSAPAGRIVEAHGALERSVEFLCCCARQCLVRIDHETMCIVDEGFCNGLCMPRGECCDENTLLCLDPRGPIETKNDSQSVGRRWMFDGA